MANISSEKQEAQTLLPLIEGGKPQEISQVQDELNQLNPSEAVAIVRLLRQLYQQDQQKSGSKLAAIGFPTLTIEQAPAAKAIDQPATTSPAQPAPEDTGSVKVAAAYADENSAVGPSAGINLTYKNTVLDVASGADASAGLNVGDNTAIMQASVKDGQWLLGALPSTMGVEQYGPTNNFNTMSDIYQNTRNTALGARYSVSDKFSLGLTGDGKPGGSLLPDTAEASYTTGVINSHFSLYAGADLGAKDSAVDSNLTYTNGKVTVAADALDTGSGVIADVEGTDQLSSNFSVSARLQSTGKVAIAVKDQVGTNGFVQLQQENNKTSIEAGLHI